MFAAGQLISVAVPVAKYNAPPPTVRQRLGDPHEVYDLCDDVFAPSPQHLCCDRTNTRGFAVLKLCQDCLDFSCGVGGDGAIRVSGGVFV